MRISDWSSDVCSSDLIGQAEGPIVSARVRQAPRITAEMPFSGKVGAITRGLQKLCDRHDAKVHYRVVTRLAAMLVGDGLGHVAQTVAVIHHPRLEDRKSTRLNSSH